MKTPLHTNIVHLSLYICVCLMVLSCKQSADTVAPDNMRKIYRLLVIAAGDGDHYPEDFTHLNKPDLDKTLFVCPGTGSHPGAMQEIHQWTDFIYIGNVYGEMPTTALIISPPENHGGNYGYVLFASGSIARLPAAQVREFVIEPWGKVTPVSQGTIVRIKEDAVILVPKRLQKFYPELTSTRRRFHPSIEK